MVKKNLNKKLDYTFAQYFHNCDFINKYNLISYQKIPCIKKITLKLSFQELVNSFIFKTSNINENNMKIISVLFFFIFTNSLPFIDFSKLKEQDTNIYSLKILFNTQQQIYNFLHDICEYFKMGKVKSFASLKTSKYFIVNEICKATHFFELDNLINKKVKTLNVKELKFFLKFQFFNPIFLKSSQQFIKNFPFLNH
jgi:hypothetical protein